MMPDFTIEEVVEAVQGTVLKKGANTFSAVVTDTRKISKGALFIALKGENFDGHDFVERAIENGAQGVVVSRVDGVPQLDHLKVTMIKVEDTLVAYQQLAKAYRNRFSIPIIAITGSNGKTTTKDLTAAILSSKFNVLKTEANFNNEIGLPLTLFQLTQEHDVAVVEMGMRGFDQIRQLTKVALPTIGIVTNVGETHMELLGSIENIALAKSELVEEISAEGLVILNGDNPYVKSMATKAKGKVIFFGLGADCTIKAENVEITGKSTAFTCNFANKQERFVLPMVGRHNVYNALGAIAVAQYLHLTADDVRRGLRDFSASGMRLAIEEIGSYIVINDAYNASPMSMNAAIEALQEVAKKRSIAVLGDMLELGDAAETAHRNVGKKLVATKVDVVIAIGEMAKWVIEEADKGGIVAIHCENHAEAGKRLKERLQPEDTILFKGSRGMKMEKVIDLL